MLTSGMSARQPTTMIKHRRISFRWLIWPAYRDALLGEAGRRRNGCNGPVAQVKFKDLWTHPDDFRGRRVSVQRSGSANLPARSASAPFPHLSKSGSPRGPATLFVECSRSATSLIVARSGPTSLDAAPPEKPAGEKTGPEIPAGPNVEFTGTFLKIVRYAGADAARLAPLIVGDQQPVPVSAERAQADTDSSVPATARASQTMIGLLVWTLGLAAAAMVAFTLARWHLRAPARSARRQTKSAELVPDLPLEFIEPHENP